MTRRNFIAGAAATAVCSQTVAATVPRLKVGILSDLHNGACFEKGLRLFDAERVDAVILAGDFINHGTIREFERTAERWFSVFPNDRRSDGGKVERLFITGNHDEVDWAGTPYKDWDDVQARCFRFHREESWRRIFGEDYEKIRIKTVKGYTFVLRHWICRAIDSFGHQVPPEEDVMPAFMAAQFKKLRTCGKPFFYVQHEPVSDTVNASWLLNGVEWDNGHIRRGEKAILDKLPNAVVLTGHSHDSLTDEMSIWQGRFTAVNCSCCANDCLFTKPGRENGVSCEDRWRQPPLEMPNLDRRQSPQALVMEVGADAIRFKRIDIPHVEKVGEDWTVPLFAGGATVPPSGAPKFDFKSRKGASRPPTFAPDAKVEVSLVKEGHHRLNGSILGQLDMTETHAQVCVSFPPITLAHSPSRGFDFSVRCETMSGDVISTACEKRVFSPRFAMSDRRETEPCNCLFALTDIPKGFHGRVRFVVTPYDCWGNPGSPIATAWLRGIS